jgi:hypothetical protein
MLNEKLEGFSCVLPRLEEFEGLIKKKTLYCERRDQWLSHLLKDCIVTLLCAFLR